MIPGDQKDPLDKGITTYSSILVWRIPWTEEPARLGAWDSKELDTTEQLTLATMTISKEESH